jgi:cysteine-rich repeat protein
MRHELFWPAVFVVGFGLMVLSAYLSHVWAADLPTNIFISICGDGLIQPTEVCDDGGANNSGAYGSSIVARHCAPGCVSFGPYCGDGILEARFAEQCDDSNNVSGDLCSATCQAETAAPPGSNGSPTVGSIPPRSSPPGTIPSALQTKVVLRGKAFPGASIDILLDGQKLSTVQADSNADFLFSSSNVTPGVATFSFLATDTHGADSFISSATFDILQSAVTTVSNIFLPPTISASALQVAPGTLLTLSGASVPGL